MRCKGCACCPCHWEHDAPHSYVRVRQHGMAWHGAQGGTVRGKEGCFDQRKAPAEHRHGNVHPASPSTLPGYRWTRRRRCALAKMFTATPPSPAWPARMCKRVGNKGGVCLRASAVTCSACGVYDSLWYRHCSKQSPHHPPPPRTEGTDAPREVWLGKKC
jgi:hypothetical protein